MFMCPYSNVDVPPCSGPSKTARILENVDAVRQFFLQSAQHSTKKHVAALGFSVRTVRRILDLKFHPHKMIVLQELFPRNFQSSLACCQKMLELVPEILLHSSAMKPVLIFQIVSTNQTSVTS